MSTVVESRGQKGLIVAGFVLALIGTAALVSEVWPQLDRYIPLVIGLGFLATYLVTRWYGALIAGSILTGLGGGLLVAALAANPQIEGAAVVLGLAFGFVAIWFAGAISQAKERHWWPLIPGSILTVVGLALLAEASGAVIASWIVPAAILTLGLSIMAGGYLVARPRSA
jgi:hypothetical protein